MTMTRATVSATIVLSSIEFCKPTALDIDIDTERDQKYMAKP